MLTADTTASPATTPAKSTVQPVANEILEAAMLTSYFAGSDTTLAKFTKRGMRFKSTGELASGDLSFTYTFPDGSKGEYKLLAGTFSTRTGFQAAAFEKTITGTDGQQHKTVKILFPGTAMRSQFSDLNAVDTFWMKRIGSQVHNAKQWMEMEVMPRLPQDATIEISGHCLGTQSALWAKAYLEEEKHRRVKSTALLEPTAAGLVIDDIIKDIQSMYAIKPTEAIKGLYRNTYSVFVDPPTIVSPFGFSAMWDTSAAGEKCYLVHLPPTKLNEELKKALTKPHAFRAEYKHKLQEIREAEAERERQQQAKLNAEPNGHAAANGEAANGPTNGAAGVAHSRTARSLARSARGSANGSAHDAVAGSNGEALTPIELRKAARRMPFMGRLEAYRLNGAALNGKSEPGTNGKLPDAESSHPHSSEKALQHKALFATALGTELGQQFFKNHYLLTMSNQILNPKAKLDEVITEAPTPDAGAMIAHRPPALQYEPMERLKQLLVGMAVDKGRDIAGLVTTFCLRGGRMGTAAVAEPHYIWDSPDIQTMDDSMPPRGQLPNYPPDYFKNHTVSEVRNVVNGLTEVIARMEAGSERRLDLEDIRELIIHAVAPGARELPAQGPDRISEVQARSAARHLPELSRILEGMVMGAPPDQALPVRLTLASLSGLRENLKRAYNIKPGQEVAHFR